MGVVEVSIVVGVAHRQSADDRRLELLGVGLPLLRGVVLDEGFVQRAADQADALLHEVLRGLVPQLGGLFRDEGPRFGRRVRRPEELVDRAQVHRHRVHLARMRGVDLVHVVGERGEPVHVLPHALVAGVEQVGPVPMHFDARGGIVLGGRSAAAVVAPIDQRDPEAEVIGCTFGDRQAEKPGPDDDEVC